MNGLVCFVISLADSQERRAPLVAALARQGIAWDMVDAVDARQGLPEACEPLVDRHRCAARLGRPILDSEIGTALSHVEALRRFLASDASHALIFEDDAIPQPGLRAFLDAEGYRRAPVIQLNHLNARVWRRGAVEVIPGCVLHRLANRPYMTVGYTLDRQAAQRIIDAQSPVSGLVDWPLDISLLGAVAVQPMLVAHPPVVPGQTTVVGRYKFRRRFPLRRYLSRAHLRRTWVKLTCPRIS